jgi:hypothetical protein
MVSAIRASAVEGMVMLIEFWEKEKILKTKMVKL